MHRTLAFAKFLREFGWDVTVLSVAPRAYESYRDENFKMVPPHVEVVRAPALDTARHLSLRGWYPRFLALPDRWQSWIITGTRVGRRLFREQRPAALLSTFPIASAHAIGLRLQRATGLPWVADFRDPMAQDGYPTDPAVWRSYARIEKQVFEHANRITVTTQGTAEYYEARYGERARQQLRVIENGFDPDAFPAERAPQASPPPGAKMLLLHSGVIYPKDRDPAPFLQALARLQREGIVSDQTLTVRFRASGYEDRYQQMIDGFGLRTLVELAPAMPYNQALDEMQHADALLLFQASTCNRQIPAKVYEYLYSGRPILGITDPEGDTGRLLARMGVPGIALLENSDAIYAMLRDKLPAIRARQYVIAKRSEVEQLSRRSRTAELAKILDEIA
ncbi:MAG TPA: glycosyltransferase [Steroidobacteraceae bacterium]|nr:glycosyltransferase [Steroidobacteraceae bacterium]HEV8694403.1 glycosyltransferase [Lysobacter sp.]